MANKERTTDSDEHRSREMTRASKRGDVRRGDYSFTPADVFSNPFSVMRRMHDEMDRVFGEAFGSRMGPTSGFGGGLMSWSPAVEVSEGKDEVVVCAELPGLKPEEVKVEVTEEALVIEGERKQEREDKQGDRWHSERHYGHFYRAIPLPEGAKTDQARADFKNGELRVTVPVQRQESKRRQIPIGAGAEQSRSR